jgi:hypothetical protein
MFGKMASVIGLCLIIPSFALPIGIQSAVDPTAEPIIQFVYPQTLSGWTLVETDAPIGWYNITLFSSIRVTDTIVSPIIHAIQNYPLDEDVNLYSTYTERIYVDGTVRLTLTNAIGNEWRPTYGFLEPLDEPNIAPELPWNLPVHVGATDVDVATTLWVAGLDMNRVKLHFVMNSVDYYSDCGECGYNMVRCSFDPTAITSLTVSTNLPFENYVIGTSTDNNQNICECETPRLTLFP